MDGIRPDRVAIYIRWSTEDQGDGTTLDRPALTELRRRVAAGAADCVVVLMSFAEWERSVIRDRTFAGKLRRAREGRNPGMPAAYGYRLGPGGALTLHPAEAAVVEKAFRLYLGGLGCRKVAERLTEQRHLSPTGRRGDPATIARMLSNPIYTGTLVYGRESTVRGLRVKSGQPHVITPGVAGAIIDQATFAAVQELKARRPGVRRPQQGSGRSLSSRSLLTGLLKCRCGRSYIGNLGAAGRDRYRYYACSAANGKGSTVCDAGRIRQDLLDRLVVERLLSAHGGPAGRDRLLQSVTQRLSADLKEAEAAEREGAALAAQEARLRDLLLTEKITVDEFRDLKGDLNTRSRSLTARLAHLDQWDSLEQPERKQLLRHFATQILAYRDRKTGEITCTIAWAWHC